MYNNYGYNPYYQPQRFQNVDQQNQQSMMTTYQPPLQLTKPTTLLGKSVDNIDVVKATDIPLDGSISYFPLTDGSAIVSKQLQNDGTSKIIVYKPVKEDKKETIQFATLGDIQEAIGDIDLSDIAQEEGILLDDVNFVEGYLDKRYKRVCHYSKTVGEFLDEHPKGTYLVTMEGHITVIKDGVLYDTFDCRNRRMWCAWHINN